ncbi:MAG TPA: glycine zipper 2TM domain-containing protein [Gammaproteobacteria bacterium]
MFGKAVLAAAVGCLAAGTASAHGHGRGHGHHHHHHYRGHADVVYARVVDVEPIVRYVTVERPRQECWQEVVYEPVHRTGVAGPTIAGGIVGAAIGRQFGSGSGRDAMTLIGSVAGAVVANQRAVRNQAYAGGTRAVTVDRCEVVPERFTEERIDGYRVTYVYEGRRHVMHSATRPGDRVALAVSAVPVRY